MVTGDHVNTALAVGTESFIVSQLDKVYLIDCDVNNNLVVLDSSGTVLNVPVEEILVKVRTQYSILDENTIDRALNLHQTEVTRESIEEYKGNESRIVKMR